MYAFRCKNLFQVARKFYNQLFAANQNTLGQLTILINSENMRPGEFPLEIDSTVQIDTTLFQYCTCYGH